MSKEQCHDVGQDAEIVPLGMECKFHHDDDPGNIDLLYHWNTLSKALVLNFMSVQLSGKYSSRIRPENLLIIIL